MTLDDLRVSRTPERVTARAESMHREFSKPNGWRLAQLGGLGASWWCP